MQFKGKEISEELLKKAEECESTFEETGFTDILDVK